MFEKRYKSMNEQIIPDQVLVDHTIELINEKRVNTGPKIAQFLRKPLAITAMLLLCIFIAMPALAADVPAIYALIYSVSPATAQFFMPVQESCMDNGIKMEVIATYIHEDTAEIYIAMQDFTAGRVDETTDLFDSYSIHRPFNSSAHCEQVSYDEATKTATFLITITEWGGHKIEGSKITFSVSSFISDKHEYENIPIEIDLSKAGGGHKTKTVSITGAGGLNYEKYQQLLKDSATVLVPSAALYSPAAGIDITGIGYVDGMLHIQTAVKNPLKKDNHGYFFLRDRYSHDRTDDYSISFIEYAEPNNEDTRICYDEYIFDIPQSELAGCALYGSFYTSGLYTEGNWQVTFPLKTQDY